MSDLAKEFFNTFKNIKWVKENVINLANNNTNFESDLVISSYMINELSSNDIEIVIDYLWNMTKKILIIVEPGTPDDFKRMYDIRKYLIQKSGIIVAPCLHTFECDILNKQDWCAFTTRVERNKIQKAVKSGDVPFEDEKFTFLAVLKKEYVEELELEPKNIARILRNPEITQNYINLMLCNQEGKIINDKVLKSNKEIFKKAKKTQNGDLFFN
jgi:ribosomal protein RSM22 (predicted rRNA methylase)